MKKILLVAVISLSSFLLNQNAFAFSWTYNDFTNLGNPESASGLTVGVGNVGDPEDESVGGPIDTSQPIQISGAGTLLPSGYPGFILNFHFNGSTWDSYKEELYYDGYYDVFAAVLSEYGYYWDLLPPDIHPLENNPKLVLGLDPFDPTPDPTNSYWGGTDAEDGVREDEDTDVTLNFTTNPTKTYYLSLFMQTRQDLDCSSWGTFSNVTVNPIPEPTSLLLLGWGLLGLGGIGIRKRRIKA